MKYQLTRLSEILACDGELKALAFAAKTNCLDRHRDAIQRGWAAHCNPEFYRQLGIDPVEAVKAGVAAVRSLIK